MGEGRSDPAIILYKLSVKVGKSQEALNYLDIRRFLPFLDCSDFLFVHTQALWGYHVSQVFYFRGVEFAFGGFQGQSSYFDLPQYCLDVFPVVLQALRKDEDIVQIYHTENIEVFDPDFFLPSLE